MNQYTMKSSHRNLLLGAMGIGLVCMILTWMSDDAYHTRFWTNFLHNTVFFLGIAFTSMFIMTASITAYAGWFTVFKRILKSKAEQELEKSMSDINERSLLILETIIGLKDKVSKDVSKMRVMSAYAKKRSSHMNN